MKKHTKNKQSSNSSEKQSRRKFIKTNLGRALIAAGAVSFLSEKAEAYPEHDNYKSHENELRHRNSNWPVVGHKNELYHENSGSHHNTTQWIHENFAKHKNEGDHANTYTHKNSDTGGACPTHTNNHKHTNKIQSHTNDNVHTNEV